MNIIAFAGRKQSGKNTAANFVIATEMKELGVVHNCAMVNKLGKVEVSDIGGDKAQAGVIDTEDAININLIKETTGIGLYSFASTLKEMCINVLGISREDCYGTDQQKGHKTHLLWENMPGVVHWKTNKGQTPTGMKDGKKVDFHKKEFVFHEPGFMTVREVLQYVGTELFRQMYPNVWINALMQQVKQEKHNIRLAIITDCRFPNEVECIQQHGGKVVGLSRMANMYTVHKSEKALDTFERSDFDGFIDNKDMSIAEQNKEVYQLLHGWDIMNISFFNKMLGEN